MGKEYSSPRSNIEGKLKTINQELRILKQANDEVCRVTKSAAEELEREEKLNAFVKRILNKYSNRGFIYFDEDYYELELIKYTEFFLLSDFVDLSVYEQSLSKFDECDFIRKGDELLLPIAQSVVERIMQLLSSHTGYTFFVTYLSLSALEYVQGKLRCQFRLQFDFR